MSDIKSVLHMIVGPSPRTPRGLCASVIGARWNPILGIQLRQRSNSQGGVTVNAKCTLPLPQTHVPMHICTNKETTEEKVGLGHCHRTDVVQVWSVCHIFCLNISLLLLQVFAWFRMSISCYVYMFL